ncbi:MAG TPA: alpha/beta fold hydrolase [Candidatus Limnocylindrales bacterium]|nr:alpha/beta fold hydrolase [Candidatus Limnocylindrales bacterium]
MWVNSERRGSGETLILIHGIGHRWQAWEPVIDRLAEHHRVVAIDLPGFGRSPVPEGGMPGSMLDVVGLIARYLREEGLERPHVAGNSLGGAIALELAAAGLVSSATAFSPGGFYTEAERRRALGILNTMRANTFIPGPVMRLGLRLPTVRRWSLVPIVEKPANLTAQRTFEDALAMRRGRGFRPVAKAARTYSFEGSPEVPVCVAWGDKDRIFGVHQAERARQKLPNAVHELLRGCGHVPMSDDPDLVCSLILRTTGALKDI